MHFLLQGGGGDGGGRPNKYTILWCMRVTVCCLSFNACMFLYVTYQKGAKNPENNKLGAVCAASPNDVRHNRKWIILPVNREWSDISNWATRAERLSCHIGPRGGWCLLTFQDGQAHQPALAVCVASHFRAPPPPPPTPWCFGLTPRFSLNIFTSPDFENTVNSNSESASKWGKCVRSMCDVVFELQATPTRMRSSANVNRQQKKE